MYISEYILTLYLDNKCRTRQSTEQHMGCSSYKYKNIQALQNFSFSIIFTHAMSELLRWRQCRLFNIKLAGPLSLLFKMGPESQPADWAFSSNKTSISFGLRYFIHFAISMMSTEKNANKNIGIFFFFQLIATFQDYIEVSWLCLFDSDLKAVVEVDNITNSTLLTLLLLNLQVQQLQVGI